MGIIIIIAAVIIYEHTQLAGWHALPIQMAHHPWRQHAVVDPNLSLHSFFRGWPSLIASALSKPVFFFSFKRECREAFWWICLGREGLESSYPIFKLGLAWSAMKKTGGEEVLVWACLQCSWWARAVCFSMILLKSNQIKSNTVMVYNWTRSINW